MKTRMMRRLIAFSLAGVMLMSLLASVTLLSDAYSADEYATMAVATYGEDEGYGYRTDYPYESEYDYDRSGYSPCDDTYGFEHGCYEPGYDNYDVEYSYCESGYDDTGFGCDYYRSEYYYYDYPYEPEDESYASADGSDDEAYQGEYGGSNYYGRAYAGYDSEDEYKSEIYGNLEYEKLGIKPFITIPPYTAVTFRDYTTEGVLITQFHTSTVGVAPYIGVSIGGMQPEHWELHRWGIIYSILNLDDGPVHRVYEFWYYTFPADYVLMHRLPDSVCLVDEVWHMLPTFRIDLIPIPPILTGTVTCEDTGRPIPDVRIDLFDGDGALITYRITDENGFFDFGEVPIGNLEVVMDYNTIPPGYETDMSQVRRPLTTSPGGVYEEHYLINPLIPPTLTKTVSYLNGEEYDGEAVDVGDEVTYVLTVYNPNPRTIRDFLVRDILPEGLALNADSVEVSPATALVNNTSTGNTVEVVLDLPAGNTTITFTATVTLAAYEYIENVAILYGPPANGGNRPEVDRDPEVIPVVEVDPPTLVKAIAYVNGEAHTGEAVYVGDIITYVLTVNNPNRRPLYDFLVRDLLPGEVRLDVESVTVHLASSLVYNNTAGNMVEVILNLPSGNTTITFSGVVTEEAYDIILNTAILYGPPGEDEPREEVDRDNEEVPVAEVISPSLVKTATHVNGVVYTGDPVDVGDRITYVLTVSNPNRRVLNDFLVRDELPDCLALQVGSVAVNPANALVYNQSADNTVEVILNLSPGDTTITFTAVVTAEAYEEIINIAILYGPPEEDGNRNEVDNDDERVPVVELGNPTITKTATYVNGEAYAGEAVDVGDVITYILTVNNPNQRILHDFLVRDVLPSCLALDVDSVVVNPEGAYVYNLSADNTVAVILNLPPGATTVTFTATVTAEAYQQIINVATIYGPPGDDGNREEVDDDDERVPVEELIDPTLEKTATHVNGEAYEGESVDIGDVITYVLTINNPNHRYQNNFMVRDVLPIGLALQADSIVVYPEGALVYDNSADNTVEVILNLPPGDTTITFTAVVTESAYEEIINVATIYGPPGDDGNRDEVDDDTEEVPVVESEPPTITKAVTHVNGTAYTGAAVVVGDVIAYVLTVNNPNRRTLYNFLVRDALPNGLALELNSIMVQPAASLGSDNSAGNTVEVILNLPSGDTTITFSAVVTAAAEDYEEIVNVAILYGPPEDDGEREQVDEDEEVVDVDVEEVALLPPTLTKSASYAGDRVQAGDVITYTLTVNNPNTVVLENFVVIDALPATLALNVASVNVNPADALVVNTTEGNTVRAILNLPAGNTIITFTAVVTDATEERIINVARLYDPEGPVDEDDVTVELVPPGGGGDNQEQPPATPPIPPAQPTPPGGPQTGDTANLILWILLTSFGLVVFTVIATRRRVVRLYNKRVDSLTDEMVHYVQDKL